MVGNKCNNYAKNSNSCKRDQNKQWNSRTFYFMFRPYGANVFKVCFQLFTLRRGLVGSVLSINVIEMSLRKPLFTITKMFVQMFLHAWYAMRMFTRTRSVIIAPVAKSVNCLTYTLSSTFVKSKEINQAFPHAVKFMINF